LGVKVNLYPKGVAQRFLCNAFSVKALLGPLTQGARQAATLGFGIQRLRRKNPASIQDGLTSTIKIHQSTIVILFGFGLAAL
jgi:hypothetical protein